MNYPLVLWRGECIPVLSFPDASGSTPVKSTRGEFSSPPDSVMIRLKILLGRLAALAGPVNKMWIPSPLTDENQVGAGDKDAGLCNTRTNTRSGGGEEDGQRRPLCGGFTETKRRADGKARSSRDETRERSHLPKHSAPFSLSVPPLPAHRIHSPVVENPLRRVQDCAVNFTRSSLLLLPQDVALCLWICAYPQLQRQRS